MNPSDLENSADAITRLKLFLEAVCASNESDDFVRQLANAKQRWTTVQELLGPQWRLDLDHIAFKSQVGGFSSDNLKAHYVLDEDFINGGSAIVLFSLVGSTWLHTLRLKNQNDFTTVGAWFDGGLPESHSIGPPQFDIAANVLAQLKRIGGVVRMILHRATAPYSNHHSSQDLTALARLIDLIDRLPCTSPGSDITLSVTISSDPTAPFRRLQFGERVIEIGDLQIKYDPRDKSNWTRMTMFGAIFKLGSGCRSDQMVKELAEWIDELEADVRDARTTWRIELGDKTAGHMIYPKELDDE